jgi:hypothetical protein
MRFASGEASAPATSKGEHPAEPSLFPLLSHAPWLAPTAVVSGALASGAVAARSDWPLPLAMAALLALAWVALWHMIANLNWRAPLAVWQSWGGVPSSNS